MVVLLQDGHELEGCEGSAHFQLREVAIKTAQDTGIVAADEKNLVTLQFQMAVQGFDQHLHRSDRDIEGLRKEGDRRGEVQFPYLV